MRYKQLSFLTAIIFFVNTVKAQNIHSAWSFNLGGKYSSLYDKNYVGQYNNDEGRSIGTKNGVILPDFNILRQVNTKLKGLSLLVGAGFNMKGFKENYQENDGGGGAYCVKNTTTKSYINLLAGADYSIFHNKNWQFFVAEMLQPEVYLGSTTNNGQSKRIGLSNRLAIIARKSLGNSKAIQVSPYWETAITKYGVDPYTNANYKPFAFGVNIGYVCFK